MLALANCGESTEEQERFVFLAADNQTGSEAFDWAIPILHRGLAAAVPGESVAADTIADARLAPGANRIVYSTLTPSDTPGEVRLHSAIFDTTGHPFDREFTVTGNVLQVINRMATSIAAETYSIGAKSEEVLRKWPVFSGDIQAFENNCAELASAEPGFSAALGSCAEQLTAGARLPALREMLGRISADQSRDFPAPAQYAFGQAYMALKEYPKAAVLFRQAAVTQPLQKNIAGYAEALSGRCEVAKQLLEEYSRLPGQEPNALDSLGETAFFCGQYPDAEKYFLAAESKMLLLPQGALEPVKAAAARLMTGDFTTANKMANAHLEKLTKTNPQGAAALKPLWTSILNAQSAEQRKQIIEVSLIRRP